MKPQTQPSLSFDCCSFSPTESVGLVLKAAEFRPSSLKVVGASACSVPCKMFQDELGDLCRREKLYCKDLCVSKSNINDYEVEFLCDYKKTKVSYRSSNTPLLSAVSGSSLSPIHTLFSFIYLLRIKEMWKNAPHFVTSSQTAVVCSWTYKRGEFIS